ncbi:hypothetical protein LEJE111609_17865 [Lelliottia jeotgali]
MCLNRVFVCKTGFTVSYIHIEQIVINWKYVNKIYL